MELTYRRILHRISDRKGIDLTYAQIAEDLNMTKQNMTFLKGQKVSDEHKKILEEKYNIILEDLNLVDSIPIEYFYHPNLGNKTINSKLPDFAYDRQVICDFWGCKKEHVKGITMWGETMDGGDRPIQDGDVIIVDTSCKNLLQTGVFAYATQNYSNYFINGIRQRADGTIEFYYHNSQFESVIKTKEQLKKVDFQIIGRMVKNVTYKM